MTDIGTDAIRHALAGYTPKQSRDALRVLCNALDAARAERDGYKAMIRPENVWRGRGEAAEARIAELSSRATEYLTLEAEANAQKVEIYQARIAAALAELEPNNCVKLPKWWVAIMKAKLNGEPK